MNLGGNNFLWIYFVIFIGVLLWAGWHSSKQIKNEDDYATARGTYSWLTIGLVIPATFASGATFMGSGGMAYGYGFPAFWYLLFYPMGGYLGMTFLGKLGVGINRSGARTIPEFLGIRYNSNFLRLLGALISFMLLAYIGGQIVAGGTIFEVLFGVDYKYGIWITTAIILSYIVIGGARANILTATIQACIMLVVALTCIAVFIAAPGLEGGISELNNALVAQNPELGAGSVFNSANMQLASGFAVAMTLFAHMPYSLLPHFGMKWAALRDNREMPKALITSAVVGMIFVIGAPLPALLARATMPNLERADMALPALFNAVLPDYLSAFLIIGIYAAIMSTASGLFVANAQAIANDVYRCTLAVKYNHDEAKAEKYVKIISRTATILIAIAATALVITPPPFLTLFLWIGVGGLLSTTTGPVLLGLFWKGVTRTAAYVSVIGCFIIYIILVTGAFGDPWPGMTATGFMFIVNLVITTLISLVTKDRMSDEYLDKIGLFKFENSKAVK